MYTELTKCGNKTVFMSGKEKVFLSRPRKGRTPEIRSYALEHFKDLRNMGLTVVRKTLMSNAKECV
jgi:hypothetical protein